MTEEKKPDNIVKKVFERSGQRQERISPLFTHYKNPQKSKKIGKPAMVVDKEPQPRRLPVSIDFGTSRIKLLQLAQDARGGLQVVLMDEEICLQEASLNPLFQTKQALEKILSRNPVGPNVIIGLPAKETQTYNFTFPPLSEEDLREAVRWKIRQLKPFDLEEDKIRYALLRWESQGTQTQAAAQQRVTVVCVSADNLSQKSTVLNEVGLKPVSVHVSPLALVNIRRFRTPSRKSEEMVLWLDLGAEESVFIVEKRGVVYFMRNLSVTGKQLTKQVAQACHISEPEAEELKRQHGLEFWTPELQANVLSDEEKKANPSAAVCYALVSLLENLVIDVEHSFKYFSYQVTQSQIQKFDRVVLAGGGSNLKRIENFLGDRLAVPVEKVDPFAVLQVQESLKNQRKNLAEDALVFASAAGLAISPLVDKESVADLLTLGRKKEENPWIGRLKLNPRLAGSLAAAIVLLLTVPQIAQAVYYKKQADQITQQVKQVRADIGHRQSSQLEFAEEEKKLLERKNKLEEKLSLFHQYAGGKKEFSEVLAKLASLMPKELWITKLSYAENKLTLVGSTSKNEYVVDFLENLKKPEDFSDVAFNYTQRDANSSVFSFEIIMTVK